MKRLISIFILISYYVLIFPQQTQQLETPPHPPAADVNRLLASEEIPTLDLADQDEDQELLDHYEAPELTPLMEWLTMAGSETVAALTRLKRALFAYLLKAKEYVILLRQSKRNEPGVGKKSSID